MLSNGPSNITVPIPNAIITYVVICPDICISRNVVNSWESMTAEVRTTTKAWWRKPTASAVPGGLMKKAIVNGTSRMVMAKWIRKSE
jgi:hypothetical protein